MWRRASPRRKDRRSIPDVVDGAPGAGMMTADEVRSIPKAELHVHLDGSLRPSTLAELAAERDVHLPVGDATNDTEALADFMVVADGTSLEHYLERFAITLSVMQDADALRRIARECVEDHAAEGVRYVEIRFCPYLNTEQGLQPNDVLDAVLRGIADGTAEPGYGPIDARLIVCGLRSHPPRSTLEMAELAVSYRDRGICGFDLAGGEAGNPVRDHIGAFDFAAKHGLPITIHAGEGYGPASVRQALQAGHARRIGHGTRLFEDPVLEATVQRAGIPLEICLTSNVQTGVVPSVEDHPAGAYIRKGMEVVLGTDNRLMSGVDLTGEYLRAIEAFSLTRREVLALARSGFEHAFTDRTIRDAMLSEFFAAVGE